MSFRKIDLSGVVNSFFVGNHGDVHLIVKGAYTIRGMVYCPRYAVELTIVGNGSIDFRGVCKSFRVRNSFGANSINLENMRIAQFSCAQVNLETEIRIGHVKRIGELNLARMGNVISDVPSEAFCVISPSGLNKIATTPL